MDGLNLQRLIRTSVEISPLAASGRNFGILLIIGDSDVINGFERYRKFFSIEEVATAFGILAPEYLAAQLFYSQNPQPIELYISRWIRTPTQALLNGSILTVTEKLISNWNSISDASFSATFDGVVENVTGVDLTLETNLNGIASTLSASLVNGVILFDGERFIAKSNSTGATSTVSYFTPEGSGTDVSAQLKLTSTTAAQAPIDGYDSETAQEALLKMMELSGKWYGVSYASSVQPTISDFLDIQNLIQTSSISRFLLTTDTDINSLDPLVSTTLCSELKTLGSNRGSVQYSQNPYAICSFFGRAATVNFNANNTLIDLMYKQEPSVVPETLTEAQADTLKEKRCNVFVNYQNETAIIQYGVTSGTAYFDEIFGTDWFKDAIQTAVYNLLYQSKTKIPQTDAGQNQVIGVCHDVCVRAVANGLFAAGVWNSDGFGQLQRGDYMPQGFYIYSIPIAAQDQATREQRIAPPIQIAGKLAGSIQQCDILVTVNR